MRVALVGAGLMAREYMKLLQGSKYFEPVGFFSRGKARAEALSGDFGLPFFGSIDSLHRHAAPDGLIVAVNEASTRQVLLEAFKFDWSVLVEKPAGYDLDDARIILESAPPTQKIFVALNRRNYESTLKASGYLKESERRFVRVQDQQNIRELVTSYGVSPESAEKYMYSNSVHLIDYFSIFCRGEVLRVEPIVAWNPSKPGVLISFIEYSSGDIGLYEATWSGPGPWAVSISTDSQRLEMKPLEFLSRQLAGQRTVENITLPVSEFKPGLERQLLQFNSAWRGEAHNLPTLKEAFRTTELISRIYS